MNQPKIQTDDPPTEGASPDHNPTGDTPNGIPKGLKDAAEASGRANDDRIATEVVAQKTKQD